MEAMTKKVNEEKKKKKISDTELDERRTRALEALEPYLSKGGIAGARANMLAAEAGAIRASFAEEDGKLRAQLAELEEARESITANLDPEALAVYTKTANRTGGVAIGKLNENTCGVCRSVIEGGRLIELRAAAPLGVCPSCKRLLVVE